MSSSVAYPVQALREHLTALEAAISVCLADPDHKPVHKLRTETRRVEALLLLLALVPGLPEHREEAAALLRVLAKLRRAAGAVRDLDVHRKLLEDFAQAHQTATDSEAGANGAKPRARKSAGKGSAATKGGQNGAATPEAVNEAALLSDAATHLRKHMQRERERTAADLQDLLKRRQAKTARAGEKLLKVLEPAKDLEIPAADLLRDAEAVLTRDGLLKPETIASLNEDELHTVRKAAKAARYVAESLPEDRAVATAAQGFEALQEAGGQWHDALELARAARRYFGKRHELTAAYREQRDGKLEAYRAALTARAKSSSSTDRKPRATAKAASPRPRAKVA